MIDTPLTQTQEDEALAAEYALGLLTDEQRQAADQRIAADPDLAQAVLLWQERLAVLADELTPVMSPARAKMNIRRQLGHIAEPLSDVPQIRAATRPRRNGGSGSSLRWLGLVIVIALAAFLFLRPDRGTDYAAQLVSDSGGLQVDARLDGREMEVDLIRGGAAEGRDLELWWIAGEADPFSLGVLPREGGALLTLPGVLDPEAGVQLALSDEPRGGSPSGRPTSDLLATADLVED